MRPVDRHLADGARAEAERDGAPRLAERDFEPLQAGAVLAGRRDEGAARVEDGDAEGLEARGPRMGERGRHDGLCFRQCQCGHGLPPQSRRSSLIDVMDRVFASTRFTMTEQYRLMPPFECIESATTTEPAGTSS